MSTLDEMSRRRKRAHQKFVSTGSKVYQKFIELEAAVYRDGALPAKAKFLAGLAVSVVINCEACMQWHVEEGAKAGITEGEALEMIEVAIKMGGAPAVVSSRLAIEVMEQVYGGKNAPEHE